MVKKSATNASKNTTSAIILAAGKGTRMKSDLPKVLHEIAGLPLVGHVVSAVLAAKCSEVVVVVDAENGALVKAALRQHFPEAPLKFTLQKEQKGTGDAAKSGLKACSKEAGQVLILCGDAPLIRPRTLKDLIKCSKKTSVSFLSALLEDPSGYGRIVRDGSGQVLAIVEDKDCDEALLEIEEINTGVYCCDYTFLNEAIKKLRSSNAQGEYYLTDIVELADGGGNKGVEAFIVSDEDETQGVNTRLQLARAALSYRTMRIVELIESGVSVEDPENLWLDAQVCIKKGARIGVGVQLYGNTLIQKNAIIDGPTVIKESIIAEGAKVHSFSHLECAQIGKETSVGPFARLREGTVLAAQSKVGNFVETKKTKIGKGAKLNHLSYIGDSEVGAAANVGAGTITCNYDGTNKYPTSIGKGSFVGSNSTLVAPVKIGAGAYIAAGSTITQDVEKDALAFGRSRQSQRKGYAKLLRQRAAAKKEAAKKKR